MNGIPIRDRFCSMKKANRSTNMRSAWDNFGVLALIQVTLLFNIIERKTEDLIKALLKDLGHSGIGAVYSEKRNRIADRN